MASPITNPEMPYLGRISEGFSDGHLVRIQGYTAPIAQRFNINLQCGDSDDADIAVHVSVRLQEGYVARNSFENGEWGEEKDDGTLTIGTGQRFEIIILSASNDYKIAVNGQHFCEFPHRISPSKITHLKIDGDVSLSVISFEGGDMAKTSSSQQNTSFGPPQQGYGGYGGYGPPQQQGYGGYGPGPQQGYGPPQGGYQPYGGGPGGYGPPGAPPGHQPAPGQPPGAGTNAPSAPPTPSAPPAASDDKPSNIYPAVNPIPNKPYIPGAGDTLPHYPTLPGGQGPPGAPPAGFPGPPSGYPTPPSGYPASPSYRGPQPGPYPGFNPPQSVIGGIPNPPIQNVGPYPRNPPPGNTPTYPVYPAYPGQGAYPRPGCYPPYPKYPGYAGDNGYQRNGNPNASPVPPGYTVYKPPEKYQQESSTMDKVKKYGLPIIGAAVGTYALSKLTGGFGLGHSSDSDSD